MGTFLERVARTYESCLTGAAYTFGVFLDPLEVEMGGGHSKVRISKEQIRLNVCEGVWGWQCHGGNICLHYSPCFQADLKVSFLVNTAVL